MISRLLHYLTCDSFQNMMITWFTVIYVIFGKLSRKILVITVNGFLFMITQKLVLRCFPTFKRHKTWNCKWSLYIKLIHTLTINNKFTVNKYYMMYVEHVFLLQSTCTRVRDVRVYHRIRDTIIAISIIENYIDTFLNTILVSSIYHTTFYLCYTHSVQ